MTDKQPEALRLANEYYEDHWIVGTKTWCRETVEELRRLHQSEREGWRYANELDQERKRLHELNAELVEALGTVIRGVPNTWDGVQKAKVVLDKAKESNHG